MKTFLIVFAVLLISNFAHAQQLPARWDELTADDFPAALQKSSRTCILPIGILEKHGLHAPIGTDLIHVREWAAHAITQEYAVVFPDYFYGQINEARHQPGTFSLPNKLILELLEATCDEIARNGFEKIILLNGHGGNPEFLEFFMQGLLNKRRSYAVYLYRPENDSAFVKEYNQLHRSDLSTDLHGGESESSIILHYRPDLMHMERATADNGENQHRSSLPDLYTPIWWYSSFPNHYAGDASKTNAKLGKLITDHEIAQFVKALKAVKADSKTIELQDEFYGAVDKVK